MQSFCAANGLTISVPKTEVVVFGGGHHDCAWKVADQHPKRSQSFTYLGMLFHEDRQIKHAVQARFSKACASVGSFPDILICNVRTRYSYWSDYSRPSCSRVPRTVVKSGPQLMQLLFRFGASSLCSTPSLAARVLALSRAASPLRSSFRNSL